MLGSTQVETALLALKIGFLFLLYLFIWRIVSSAGRDLRPPNESIVLPPQQVASLVQAPSAREVGRLVVVSSPSLDEGDIYPLGVTPVSVGRAETNDVTIRRDEYASARHARFEPRREGVYVDDVGSTNGTYVNGERVDHEQLLAPGDVVRIGETDLRFES
jgi:hypothetical protein